jgi:3',5'-cyclic AMP phosphodiesterase CpdA
VVEARLQLGRDDVTVVAAGDIACSPDDPAFNRGRGLGNRCRQAWTARLAAQADPDAVLVLGDAQYEEGTLRDYRLSYDRSWGKFRDRTLAVVGNHEYGAGPGAPGYHRYFGRRAGSREGWYARDLGTWRLIGLNSNCQLIDCGPGSQQYRWLARELADHPTACSLAFMHHPLVSSGPHGPDPSIRPLWELLYRSGVDVALAGHDHLYERFAPIGPDGSARTNGVRLFVAGTGGAEQYGVAARQPASEVVRAGSFGVVRLELGADRYSWRFVAAGGAGPTDAGTESCHGPA